MRLLSSLTAAGTVHTNSTDEAVLGSYTFAGDFWQPGKVVRARAMVRVLDNNASDTLTIYVRLGAVGLTGTAIYTSAAVNSDDGDLAAYDIEMVCRDSDASATIVTNTIGCNPDATGEAADVQAVIVSSLDLTASTTVAVTGDWSAANADNQVQIESLTIFEAA